MLTVVLKATRGDPQVKVPAPGLETGSHPIKRRRHGQPAPIVAAPHATRGLIRPHGRARRQAAPRSGSDPPQTTTRSPAPNSQGSATAAAIRLRRPFHGGGQPAHAEVGGLSDNPWMTAGGCRLLLVLARTWHAGRSGLGCPVGFPERRWGAGGEVS